MFSKMESGLLNTFHDDHCDGTYVKYENDSSLWSDVTDAIGLQLTETLHGILPATSNDDKLNYFENDIEIKNTYRIKHDLDQSNYIKNEYHHHTSNSMYKKQEPSIFGNSNANNMRDDYIVTQYIPADDFYNTMSPSVEVISVDPNCEFESPSSEDDSDSDSNSSDSSSSDEEGDDEEKTDAKQAKDEQEEDSSSSSNSDDSSDENSNTSISDYCGSSDEDSDNDEVFERTTSNVQNQNQCQVNDVINCENTNNASVISTDHHKPKKRHHKKSLSLPLSPIHSDFTEVLNYTNCSLQGIELNEIESKLGDCVDTCHKPLEAEIDEKHFDLATFITQDDDEFRPGVLSSLPPKDLFAPCKPKVQSIPIKSIKAEISSDSDSDESIDIETVQENTAVSQGIDESEFGDANEKFPQVDDDPIRDPSWSPSRVKNSKPSRVNTRSRARINNSLNKNMNPKPVKSTNSAMPQNNRFNKKPQSSLSTATTEKSKAAKPTSNPPVYNINRKKFGLGRGKNISMCSKPETCDTDEFDKEKPKTKSVPKEKAPEKVSAIINSSNIKAEKETKPSISVSVKQEQKKHDPRNNAVKVEKKTGSNKPVELSRIASNIKKDAVVVKQETINANKPTVQPIIKVEKTEIAETKPTIVDVVQEKVVEVKKEEVALPPPEPIVVPTKKKLNLEEYKRRREILSSGGQIPDNTKNSLDSKADRKPGETAKIDKPLNTQNKVETIVNNVNTINTNNTNKNPNVNNNIKPNNLNAKQHSLLLKNYIPVNKPGTKFYDPIIEAKNKVLRMQELKKVARTKLIDVTVSSKVGPVTKILPLEQITSMGKNKDNSGKNDENKKINSEYEEIIIVSASANTDITIPPVFEKLAANNPDSKSSSSLLYNINDTIQKASMCGEAVKISSNSLISSIQDVVLKKSGPDMLLSSNSSPFHKSPNVGVSPPSQFSPEKPEMSKTAECINAVRKAALSSDKPVADSEANAAKMEHGEDKIIMHLRKDRIRQKTISVSTQTDFLTQFPALKLLHIDMRVSKTQDSQFHSDKLRRKQKRSYRSRATSCSSDEGDRKPRSRSSLRSISPHDRTRSISPRHNHQGSTDRRIGTYQSNKHRTSSPYRKKHKRSTSRSSSRTNASKRRVSRSRSRSCSSAYSDRTDKQGRSRSRHRRRYNYSRSPSSESSYTSKSRSRSRSSRSRSRSKSKTRCRRSRSRSRSNHRRQERMSSPAVEERRIVYVGRIEKETSKDDLKRKFISYGPIRKITLHYKDTGMKYGFVTFERAQDAFKAIDNALRDPKIDQYDVSFGGRRAFCRASYSDLDNAATNSLQGLTYNSPALARPQEDDSFEALLQKVKKKISATKSSVGSPRVKT